MSRGSPIALGATIRGYGFPIARVTPRSGNKDFKGCLRTHRLVCCRSTRDWPVKGRSGSNSVSSPPPTRRAKTPRRAVASPARFYALKHTTTWRMIIRQAKLVGPWADSGTSGRIPRAPAVLMRGLHDQSE